MQKWNRHTLPGLIYWHNHGKSPSPNNPLCFLIIHIPENTEGKAKKVKPINYTPLQVTNTSKIIFLHKMQKCVSPLRVLGNVKRIPKSIVQTLSAVPTTEPGTPAIWGRD